MAAGVTPDLIFSDSLRKKTDSRSSLRNCLKAMRPQSTLIILTLDRLGDSLLDVIDLGDFFLRREVGLNVLSGIGSDFDFTSVSGRKALEVWALLSDLQKKCRNEVISKGLTESRARGIIGGPRFKLSKKQVIRAQRIMASRDITVKQLCLELGIGTVTLYRYVDPYGNLREYGRRILNE